MIRDLKYMIFGGIKWRFRGFLIGVAVGAALMSFGGSYVLDLIPQARAFDDVEYNTGTQDMDSLIQEDGAVYPAPCWGQGFEIMANGTLDSLTFYQGEIDGSILLPFHVRIVPSTDFTSDTIWPFATLISVNYDAFPQAHTTLSGLATTVEKGERYVAYYCHDSPIQTASSGKDWSPYFTESNYAHGNAGFSNDRTGATGWEPTSSDMFIEWVQDGVTYSTGTDLNLVQGPYQKVDWSASPSGKYSLGFNCSVDGEIWGLSPTLLDVVYSKVSDCSSSFGQGTVNLDLDTGISTDWNLKFTLDSGITFQDVYNITIFHDDLTQTYIDLGGDSDDGNLLTSAVGTVWDFIKSIPIYGDVLTISDMVFRDFFLRLNSSSYTGIFTVNGTFMGVTINESYDIEAMAASVGDPVNLVSGFESYKILITSMLLFSVVFSLWHNFSKKHGE